MVNDIQKAKSWIASADALLIGASNGLSIAEGYNIFASNEMFRQQFGDMQQRFGFMSVIQGCFYQYPTEADRQEFVSRLVKYWITDYKPSQVMKDLRAVVGDKPYFIITSNADTHLELSGFDAEKVFEIEGTFLNASGEVKDKNAQLQAFLRPYLEQRESNHSPLPCRENREHSVGQYSVKRLVVLELGIGSRNTLIKQPLMQLVAQLPNALYITLNLERELYIPQEIADRSIGLAGDIAETLHDLVLI